jgi:RNA polymerase sigma-70 factor (ECF subfamily)
MATGLASSVEGLAADCKRGPLSDQPTPDLSHDAVLVRAAQDGDRASFGRLYERYARMVHGVLLAKVPPDDVDDLVQDVFLKALRSLRTLRETSSFGAWLAAIARNRANDYHRRSLPEEPLADDPRDNQLDLGKTARHEAPAAEVLEAIRSLPGAYKETLIMRLVEGMTGPEIAARTGLTPGSVRVNLHRGMQHLRAKLCPTPSNKDSAQEPS